MTSDGEDFVIHSYKQRDPIPTVLHHYPVCVSYAIFENGCVIIVRYEKLVFHNLGVFIQQNIVI